MTDLQNVNDIATGFKSAEKTLRVTLRKLESKSKLATIKVANLIKREIKETGEKVQPVKTGLLAKSLRVDRKWLKGGRLSIKIWYYKKQWTRRVKGKKGKLGKPRLFKQEYAGTVHEMTGSDIEWTRSGSGALWVKKAIENNQTEIRKIYARYTKNV